MFFHQFGDDFVLALELIPQRRDRSQVRLLGRAALVLEGRGTVLEEQLLLGIEQGGREPVLIAKVGDGYMVDQMTPEDGDLLDGRIVLAGLSHRRNSSRVLL
jgi:hypothetical protein